MSRKYRSSSLQVACWWRCPSNARRSDATALDDERPLQTTLPHAPGFSACLSIRVQPGPWISLVWGACSSIHPRGSANLPYVGQQGTSQGYAALPWLISLLVDHPKPRVSTLSTRQCPAFSEHSPSGDVGQGTGRRNDGHTTAEHGLSERAAESFAHAQLHIEPRALIKAFQVLL